MADATSKPAVERMQPPDVLWKYVVNPVMRRLLKARTHTLVDDQLALLAYRGRKSGKDYEVPIGYHWIDGRPKVLTNSRWRANFRGGHPLRVRFRGEWRTGTGNLVEIPEDVARVYAQLIEEVGWKKAARRLGIRINVDRAPTHDELVDAVRREGLSILDLDIGATEP